jgi:hypothetical protein
VVGEELPTPELVVAIEGRPDLGDVLDSDPVADLEAGRFPELDAVPVLDAVADEELVSVNDSVYQVEGKRVAIVRILKLAAFKGASLRCW